MASVELAIFVRVAPRMKGNSLAEIPMCTALRDPLYQSQFPKGTCRQAVARQQEKARQLLREGTTRVEVSSTAAPLGIMVTAKDSRQESAQESVKRVTIALPDPPTRLRTSAAVRRDSVPEGAAHLGWCCPRTIPQLFTGTNAVQDCTGILQMAPTVHTTHH